MSNRQARRNAKANRRVSKGGLMIHGDGGIPNFILDDTDLFYLNAATDPNRDWSKPLEGERDWELRRFGWTRWSNEEV